MTNATLTHTHTPIRKRNYTYKTDDDDSNAAASAVVVVVVVVNKKKIQYSIHTLKHTHCSIDVEYYSDNKDRARARVCVFVGLCVHRTTKMFSTTKNLMNFHLKSMPIHVPPIIMYVFRVKLLLF